MVDRATILVFAYTLICGGVADAGLPHWARRSQAPYPSDTYAPETRHYIVVDPVVVGTPPVSKGLMKKVPPAGQILWRQNVEAVPTYPWGWFGARRHWHNTAHQRYYANERDWGYMRGD
ncbi:MAG TPA: hypothetical protein VNH11_06950 [Pirellulales bacterium]|nr:hypothetical protein [Pirellulales bacterium]